MANPLTRSAPPIAAGHAPPIRHRWPVRAFDGPHPVRATFGEPRGLVGVKGAAGLTGAALVEFLETLNPLAVVGRRIIHHGIDIKAPDGTKVFAVTDGVASVGGGTGYGRWVQVGVFRYIHLDNTVDPGTHVRAFHTVIGTVYKGQGHVHFTRWYQGNPVNPLRFGGPVGYADTAKPVIENMIALGANGQRVALDEISGPVALLVRAVDVQSQGGLEGGLYRLSYAITDADGRVAVGPYNVLQMDMIPSIAYGNIMYTVQSTRHTLQPSWLYRLTLKSPSGDGLLRTGRLRPGRYTVEVVTGDLKNNIERRYFPITVHPPT